MIKGIYLHDPPPFDGPFFMTPLFSESQNVVTLPLFLPPSPPLLISDKSLMKRHYQDLGSASGLRAAWEISFNQSEALTRYGNMEFLRSFLRRHLAGKPVVASPNVSCFLRLGFVQYFSNANKFVRISEW